MDLDPPKLLKNKYFDAKVMDLDRFVVWTEIIFQYGMVEGEIILRWDNFGEGWDNLGEIILRWDNLGEIILGWDNLSEGWDNLGEIILRRDNLGEIILGWDNLGEIILRWDNFSGGEIILRCVVFVTSRVLFQRWCTLRSVLFLTMHPPLFSGAAKQYIFRIFNRCFKKVRFIAKSGYCEE